MDATYNRCRTALEELGLRISPALEEVRGAITSAANFPRPAESPSRPPASPYKEERRLVSVLFAELAGRSAGRLTPRTA